MDVIIFAVWVGLALFYVQVRSSKDLQAVCKRLAERFDRIDARLATMESLVVAQEKQRTIDDALIRAVVDEED